jgi:hypothetical protein
VNLVDPFGLSADKGVDDVVNGSVSLDDCLGGCDRLRQTDLSGLKSAWQRRALPTLIAGGVFAIGAIAAVKIPHPAATAGGIIAMVASGGYAIYEWIHSSNAEVKDQKKARDRFGRCCAGCGDKWQDMGAALDHFQHTYPDWQGDK